MIVFVPDVVEFEDRQVLRSTNLLKLSHKLGIRFANVKLTSLFHCDFVNDSQLEFNLADCETANLMKVECAAHFVDHVFANHQLALNIFGFLTAIFYQNVDFQKFVDFNVFFLRINLQQILAEFLTFNLKGALLRL